MSVSANYHNSDINNIRVKSAEYWRNFEITAGLNLLTIAAVNEDIPLVIERIFQLSECLKKYDLVSVPTAIIQ